MSQSAPNDISFKTINLEFLRASACFALAGGCWQAFVPEAAVFGFMAVIFVVVGLKRLWFGVWALIQWIKSQRKLDQFKASGAAPKADRLAREDDLRARGLIR